MPDSKVAILIGKPLLPGGRDEDEVRERVNTYPILETVVEYAANHRWPVIPLPSPQAADYAMRHSEGLGKEIAFIFLDSDSFHDEIALQVRGLCALRQKGVVRVVVFAKSNESDGEIVVGCLEAGARDFLLRDWGTKDLAERLSNALHGRDLARPFDDIPIFGQNEYVFVITPFSYTADYEYRSGIKCALDALGLVPKRGDEHRTSKDDLATKISGDIRKSKLVIANITRYDGHNNPNVFYEIGYAKAKSKRVILIQKGDAPLPTDLVGTECLYYVNCSDLASQLYHALKHCRSSARNDRNFNNTP